MNNRQTVRKNPIVTRSLTREEASRANMAESFGKAREARIAQGVKKSERANGNGPFQRVCMDCGAHGQSSPESPIELWWHFPDALGWKSVERMIEQGPTHKIVGCGICGSHKLQGILFADPILPD